MERKLEFEYIKIKDLFIQKTGKYYSKQFIENNKGKYPIYSSQTENDGIYGYINTYCLDGEFITYTTRGKYAGTVFYRSGKFSTTSNCAYLVVKNNNKKINIKFLSYLLSIFIKKLVISTGQGQINLSAVENIVLPIPTIEIQNKIVEILDSLETYVKDINNGLPKEIKERKKQYKYYLNKLLNFD